MSDVSPVDERTLALLADPKSAVAALPEAERLEYERCQESVVRARHEAGREGREVWL